MMNLHFRLFYSLFLSIKGEGAARAVVNLLTVLLSMNLFAIFEIAMYPVLGGPPFNKFIHIGTLLLIAVLVNRAFTRKFVIKKGYEKVVVRHPSLNKFLSIVYFLFSCLFFPITMGFLYS